MLILNLKTYPQVVGQSLLPTLQVIAEVVAEQPELHQHLVIAPALVDLALAQSMQPQLSFASQMAENLSQGSTTGHTPLSLVNEIGVEYVLANHSESRIGIADTNSLVLAAKELGLKTIACCENVDEAKELLASKPYAIAFEPKELIGSGISVTTRPESVTDFVQLLNGTGVQAIIGAGVSNADDIKSAVRLGAQGTLMASAFARVEDKKSFLLELAYAML